MMKKFISAYVATYVILFATMLLMTALCCSLLYFMTGGGLIPAQLLTDAVINQAGPAQMLQLAVLVLALVVYAYVSVRKNKR